MTGTAALALGSAQLSKLIWPISPPAKRVLTYLDSGGQAEGMRTGTCFLSSQADFASFDKKCLALATNQPNILLIGDSHGAHYYPGLAAALPDAHILQATASGCKPLLMDHGETRCVELMRYIFDEFIPNHRLDGVVISARWGKGDAEAAVAAVRSIKRHVPHVVVSGPIAEYDVALPRLIARSIDYNQPIADHLVAEIPSVDGEFEQTFAREGLPYVSPLQAMCRPKCLVWARRSVPLQFDYGHMTAEGSDVVIGRLAPSLRAGLGLREKP
jgi:hypothetical protein